MHSRKTHLQPCLCIAFTPHLLLQLYNFFDRAIVADRQSKHKRPLTMKFLLLLLSGLLATASAFAPSPAKPIRSDFVARPTAAAASEEDGADKADNFRKADFIASISEKTGMSKKESEDALKAVLDTVREQVGAGKRVSLPGFGTFTLKHRSARKGRNPQTGEELQIAASKSPGFSAAKSFKEMVNGGK
jgi:DNA-binding protein HU-beta